MPRVDSDRLWDIVNECFEQLAKEEYDIRFVPSGKWTAAPWRFQSGRPLGGFFRKLEPVLAARVKALENFRIPKGEARVTKLVQQPLSQSVHFVYGEAVSFLAEDPNANVR